MDLPQITDFEKAKTENEECNRRNYKNNASGL